MTVPALCKNNYCFVGVIDIYLDILQGIKGKDKMCILYGSVYVNITVCYGII